MPENERTYFDQFYPSDEPEQPVPPILVENFAMPPDPHRIIQGANGWFETHNFYDNPPKWVRIEQPANFPT